MTRLILVLLFASVTAARAQTPVQYRESWSVTQAQPELGEPRWLATVDGCEHWVTDRHTGIFRLSCRGSIEGTIGRSGRGPGEYQWPGPIFAADGGFGLVDIRLERVTLFTPDADVITTKPITVPSYVNLQEIAGAGISGDDFFVWVLNRPIGFRQPLDNSAVLLRGNMSANPIRLDSILVVPSREMIVATDELNTLAIDAPFQDRPLFTITNHGAVLVRTRATDMAIYDRTGRQAGSIRLPLQATAVTRADRQAYENEMRSKLFGELERQPFGPDLRKRFSDKFEAVLSSIEYPDTRERIEAIATDRNTLWVLAAGDLRRPREWIVIDLGTRSIRGRVLVPHRGRVTTANVLAGDGLLVTENIAPDEFRIVRYDKM